MSRNNYEYQTILPMKKILLGEVEHEVRVTKIGAGYNVRVFVNGELNQEARCKSKDQISFTAKSLLRWEDKNGNFSEFASSARKRM